MSQETTNVQTALSDAVSEIQPQENSTESTENSQETSAEDTQSQSIQSQPNSKPNKVQKKEIQKQLKKLKLKVDGEEFDEEFDLNDDQYLTRQLQFAKVAQKRIASQQQLEKEVMELIDNLKKNPRKILSDPNIGIDLKQFAASIIEEEIANSKKSPEQLEKERLEHELKELKAQREKEQEEGKAKEFERLREQEFERYDTLMTQALDKSDLPKEPYVIKKMADYMLLGLQSGKDVTPQDVLPLVREEILNDIKHLSQVLPEDTLEALFGEVADKIRRKKVNKAKQANSNPALKAPTNAPQTGKSNEKKEVKEKQNYKSFFGV